MKPFTNECGSRNDFGYFDRIVREIVLNRPCLKRPDLEESYRWLEEDDQLRRFSVGLGTVELFTSEGNANSICAMAKGVLKNTIVKIKQSDAEMLREFFTRLKTKQKLRNLGLKCFMFYDNEELFNDLLDTLRSLDNLVFLSLAGCFFSEEQLVALAEFLSQSRISNVVWPEQHISEVSLKKIVEILSQNESIVVFSDAPAEMKQLAKRNRDNLLSLGKRNRMLNDDEIAKIKSYKESIRLAITYERDILRELEKTFEGTFIEPEDCRYMQYDPLMRIYKKA